MRKFALILALAGLCALALAAPVMGANGGRTLSTDLNGAEEVPGPGDPDGSGFATLRLNPGLGEICYSITVSGIGPGAEAHIHEATSGQDGPAIIGLKLLPDGSTSGCVRATRSLIYKISRNPSDYYVHIHDREHPHGALRGQI